MPAAKPLARSAAHGPRRTPAAARRTVFNSPNRRREVMRAAVWTFAAGAAVVVPYLVL